MNTATSKKRGSHYGQKNNKLNTNQSGKSSKHATKKSTSHKGKAQIDFLIYEFVAVLFKLLKKNLIKQH